jgi:endonuclease I
VESRYLHERMAPYLWGVLMMNITVISLFFLVSINGFGQIPIGYYNNTSGLNGAQLKTALHNIIKGHTEFPYTSTNTDVWDILKQTDKDPNDTNNVILFYTGWSVNAAQEWNSGNGWNREHIWSKSHGAFGTTQGAGTDAHHLRPADPSVNSAKNSRWFDNCLTPYLDNGLYTGCYIGSTNWVWQPRDEVKGDVARMIFYMATRYEGGVGEPDLELIDFLPINNNTSDSVYAKLTTLIQWHNTDTVDSWERNRNDIIYYDFQNNRNPFIDHPEFVNLIWCTPNGLLGEHNETICFGDSITVNNNVYDASNLTGTEVFTNVGANNCDSTVTINLTILPAIDVTIKNTSPTLTANQNGATYQWLDCDNGKAIIPNETGFSFTAIANGNYAVVIKVGNCVDTSACENINTVGIENNSFGKNVTINPNPTTGSIIIELEETKSSIILSLTNEIGQVVLAKNYTSTNHIDIDLDVPKGVYFLRLEMDRDVIIKKVIKD